MCSKRASQIAPAIDDADNLYSFDLPLVCIRMGFIKDQIRSLNENPRRGKDFGVTSSKSRQLRQMLRGGLDYGVEFLRCIGVIQADIDVNV